MARDLDGTLDRTATQEKQRVHGQQLQGSALDGSGVQGDGAGNPEEFPTIFAEEFYFWAQSIRIHSRKRSSRCIGFAFDYVDHSFFEGAENRNILFRRQWSF